MTGICSTARSDFVGVNLARAGEDRGRLKSQLLVLLRQPETEERERVKRRDRSFIANRCCTLQRREAAVWQGGGGGQLLPGDRENENKGNGGAEVGVQRDREASRGFWFRP
ncbi:hypothetical protein JCGZ_00625 [Jatropha curcas]|uniref:Uncharacterized protein n=1 Tax=Jatropha curcas TaxID=180498 RepID=A0A067JGD2_JATCU|nr:hypothetical protein JCGZ_00625 [Jatropha curcas]